MNDFTTKIQVVKLFGEDMRDKTAGIADNWRLIFTNTNSCCPTVDEPTADYRVITVKTRQFFCLLVDVRTIIWSFCLMNYFLTFHKGHISPFSAIKGFLNV